MMDLRMHDVLAPGLRFPQGAAPRPAPDAGSWQRELALAQHGREAGTPDGAWPVRLAMQERDRGSELEPCGIPPAAGAPAPPVQASPAPAAARTCEAGAPHSGNEARECSSDRPAVRVHVDARDAQRMTVWLGLDGTQPPLADRAARIVSALHQALQATPERLATVVCNGVTVYAAGASVVARGRAPRPRSQTLP